VEVGVQEFFASKDGFTRHSRNWLKNGWRPLNMRAHILNIELLLFYMFWPIKLFISNLTLFMGHPQYVTTLSNVTVAYSGLFWLLCVMM
jgi:hypothetical protein